jgi:hypothetical protein
VRILRAFRQLERELVILLALLLLVLLLVLMLLPVQEPTHHEGWLHQ